MFICLFVYLFIYLFVGLLTVQGGMTWSGVFTAPELTVDTVLNVLGTSLSLSLCSSSSSFVNLFKRDERGSRREYNTRRVASARASTVRLYHHCHHRRHHRHRSHSRKFCIFIYISFFALCINNNNILYLHKYIHIHSQTKYSFVYLLSSNSYHI